MKKYNVLFLCTGNSTRSIIAEATLNLLGKDRFSAFSAGSKPQDQPNPFALATLAANGVPAAGLSPKSWSVFEPRESPPMDIVITLCESAAAETCPVWPGTPVSAHWCLPDPTTVTGDDSVKREAFAQTFASIRTRVERLVELPVEALEPDELRGRIIEIHDSAAHS